MSWHFVHWFLTVSGLTAGVVARRVPSSSTSGLPAEPSACDVTGFIPALPWQVRHRSSYAPTALTLPLSILRLFWRLAWVLSMWPM